jgi:putative membrane protein
MTVACRNLARQSIAHITQDRDGAERIDSLVRWTISFALVLKQHLRGDRELSAELKGLVRSAHIVDISRQQHRPIYVLERISAELVDARRRGHLDVVEQIAIDANVTALTDSLGVMERILRTKMPFAYVVHLRSFLVIWLLALPFTLVVYLHWGAVIACTLIAYSLLGLETIGVEVEQPFGRDYCDLPLDQLAAALTSNLLEALKRHSKQTQQLQPSSGARGGGGVGGAGYGSARGERSAGGKARRLGLGLGLGGRVPQGRVNRATSLFPLE